MPLQKVAHRDFGKGVVSLPGAISEAGQEPREFALAVNELEPALMLVGDFDTGGVGVLANPPCALDRKSTRLNSSHIQKSRMPSSA